MMPPPNSDASATRTPSDSSRSRSAAPARTIPPASRLDTASARSLVELMTVIFLASGPSRSRPRANRVDVDIGGCHHDSADARHGALAARSAQHAQGLERQQRPHAVRHDVNAAAARRFGDRGEQVLERIARPHGAFAIAHIAEGRAGRGPGEQSPSRLESGCPPTIRWSRWRPSRSFRDSRGCRAADRGPTPPARRSAPHCRDRGNRPTRWSSRRSRRSDPPGQRSVRRQPRLREDQVGGALGAEPRLPDGSLTGRRVVATSSADAFDAGDRGEARHRRSSLRRRSSRQGEGRGKPRRQGGGAGLSMMPVEPKSERAVSPSIVARG